MQCRGQLWCVCKAHQSFHDKGKRGENGSVDTKLFTALKKEKLLENAPFQKMHWFVSYIILSTFAMELKCKSSLVKSNNNHLQKQSY